jgi:hypothetical protein
VFFVVLDLGIVSMWIDFLHSLLCADCECSGDHFPVADNTECC